MRCNTNDMMFALICTLLAFYMGPFTVYQFATCSGGRAGIAKAKELGCDPEITHLPLEDAASCRLPDLSSCHNETIISLARAAADQSFDQVKNTGAIAIVAVGIFAVACINMYQARQNRAPGPSLSK